MSSSTILCLIHLVRNGYLVSRYGIWGEIIVLSWWKVCEIRFEQKFMVPHTLADKSSAIRNWFIARAEEKILPPVALHAKNLGVKFKEAKVGHGSIVEVLVRQLTM